MAVYSPNQLYIAAASAPEAPGWFQHVRPPGEPHSDAGGESQVAWGRADAEARYFQWRAYFAEHLLAAVENIKLEGPQGHS